MAVEVAVDLRDPFFKKLYPKLQEQLGSRVADLAHGGATAIPEDTVSTAEKYAAKVAYVKCLEEVIALCEEIQNDTYGSEKG
jgi:hypothetical protein